MGKKKENIVYADPTKKKFVVTLERDGKHCVLVYVRDWGLELRGSKYGAELRIKRPPKKIKRPPPTKKNK